MVWQLLRLILAGSVHLGTATTFSAVDAGNPDPHLACYGRDLVDTDLVVAHRTIGCRKGVWLYNPRTRRSVRARIGDRGPRHAMVDLSEAVARRLGANGLELVVLVEDR